MKNILFVASEGVPFIKTGGLADVVGALPKYLDKSRYDVRVMLPNYMAIPAKFKEKMQYKTHFYMELAWRNQYVGVLEAVIDGITFYLIDNEYYFAGDKPYGNIHEDIEKFAFFSRAVLSALPQIGFRPDLIHCNDWQTGLIPVYLHDSFEQGEFYRGIKSVMTIHNLKFQGVWDKKTVMDIAGLDAYYFTPDKLEAYGDANYLKGGIVYADYVTTVSDTYAEEIKTPFYGEGLDGLMRARSNNLWGIVNGIDYEEYNPETGKVEDVKGGAFSHFGASHNYSGSISMSTRIYGLFQFGKHRKLQAIRHVVSPSLSASFSPEKGTYFNGYRTLTYTDRNGVVQTQDYNIYQGMGTGSPPGKGKTASLSFSLGNNFEAKMRDLTDTTGTGTKKVKLIDQLNFNTGYNFLAEEFNMSNVGVTMSTSIFGKLGISANANFDPYAILVDEKNKSGKRINKFALTEGQGLLRLNTTSVSLSYSLSGDGKIAGNDGTAQAGGNPADHYTRIYYHPVTGEYIPGGWLYYMNPNVPWSVNFNYSYSFKKGYQWANGKQTANNSHTQTLGVSGNVKLTPRLAMQLTTGFDLMALKMTTTQFSATYDLHCFNIRVSWVPNGQWESWTFQIAANAAALADLLKYKKSSSYWDNNAF